MLYKRELQPIFHFVHLPVSLPECIPPLTANTTFQNLLSLILSHHTFQPYCKSHFPWEVNLLLQAEVIAFLYSLSTGLLNLL